MSQEAFEDYAAKLERDEFEDDVRSLSASLYQLIAAREDTIKKLRASADYLDSIWFRCKITRSLGTSASVVGGSLTIAGGILTLTTAGLAAPLLIAGIATSSVGAATNIGSSIIEKIINSKQITQMTGALNVDQELTLKIEEQIDDLRRYKDSVHLGALIAAMEVLLGANHILIAILHSLFRFDMSGFLGVSAKFFSEGVHNAIISISETKNVVNAIAINKSLSDTALVHAAAASGGALGAASVMSSSTTMLSKECSGKVCKQASKDGLKYNPFGPDIFVETGKVVGQNSTRLAGRVIIGVSAAFLVWDAVDLGMTIADLVRKKGSHASAILRQKADQLESALGETKAKYQLNMMLD